MANQPITPDMVSRYYDGLLDDDQARRVAQHLESGPEDQRRLDAYAMFDQAMQPDLSDDEIDHLVSDTVQQVHQRLARPVRRTSNGWSWMLAPRFIMAACVVLALFTVVVVPQIQGPSLQIAENPQQPKPEIDPVQQQALLAVTHFASSYISSGVNAVSERSETLAETYKALETKSEASIALSAIRKEFNALNTSDEPKTDSAVATEQLDAVSQLEELKRRQAMIGLGASLFTFMSMI